MTPALTPALRRTGFLLALGGAVAFSAKAILAKLLYRHGVDAVIVVGLRMLFAAPFFAWMVWRGSRGRAPLSRAQWGRVAVLGFAGYYLASMLDFLGLQYISASLERLVLYVYPTLVLLIAAARGARRLQGRQWAAMGLSYAGVLVAFGAEAQAGLAASPGHLALGTALVVGSALAYAVYLVLSGETVAEIGSLRLTGLASGVACVLCIGQWLLLRPVWSTPLPAPVWGLSLLNATLCTALPMWMTMRAIELVGPGVTAQVGMVGPLATVGLGIALLGEPFTATLAVGTVLVLAGIAWLARLR